MSLVNGDFETAGALPGDASGWTAALTATYEEYAGFGAGNLAVETFEAEWGNTLKSAFLDADLDRCVFNSVPDGFASTVEGFEVLWDNAPGFLTDLASTEAAVFSGGVVEGFETGWDNDAYKTAFVGVGSDLVTSGVDNFEAGWVAGYKTAFVGVGTDLTAASFYPAGTPLAYDNFETVFAPRPFTANASTDVLTSVAHGLVLNQPVTLAGGGELPGGLQTGVTYYAITITADTLQLSVSPSGSAVNLTDVGSGERLLVPDPQKYWTLLMSTL